MRTKSKVYMNLKKILKIIAVCTAFLILIAFVGSHLYVTKIMTKPLNIHITNNDNTTHLVELKIYKNKLVYHKTLKIDPGKTIVLGNIARETGTYRIVLTLDGRKTESFSTKVDFGYAGTRIFIEKSKVEISRVVY